MMPKSKTKKRILYVEQSRVGTTGGSHTCLLDMIRRLDRQEYTLVVMFYEENVLLEEFRKAADRVVVYKRPTMLDIGRRYPILVSPSMRLPYGVLLAFQKTYNFALIFYLFLSFLVFLRREKIDLVHLNNAFYIGYDWLLASKFCAVKCITHQRGLQEAPRSGKILVKLYDSVVCVSEHIRQALKKNHLPVDKKAHVIYDGLDIGAFRAGLRRDPSLVREELGFGQGEPLIGVVGNIKRWKGQEVAIEAVSLLKAKFGRIRCLLIGDAAEDSRYYQSLQDSVVSKGLSENVIFIGFRKEVRDLIRAVDILVLPSIKPEPFGRVVLEGMALGRPVIATDMGGPREIIEDNISGFLVRPEDPVALAEKIAYLLDRPELRRQVGRAAEKRVESAFALEDTVANTELLYATILTNGVNGSGKD